MSIWFTEELHPYYRKGVRVKRILADEQTQYQHLQFVETEFFGNAMILDGIIQLTERDNMGYHEMIVHVPMLAVGQPKRVLIVGGGDGGSLQQVLRSSHRPRKHRGFLALGPRSPPSPVGPGW